MHYFRKALLIILAPFQLLAATDPACIETLLAQAEHFQKAVLALANQEADQFISALKEKQFSEDQQLTLWKLLASTNFDSAAQALSQLQLLPSVRDNVVRILSRKSPELIVQNIQKWTLPADLRFEVAKNLASQVEMGSHLERFDLKSEMERSEIAVIQLKADKEVFPKYKGKYRLTSPEALFPVLLALAGHGNLFGQPLDSRQYRPNQQYDIEGIGQVYVDAYGRAQVIRNGHYVSYDPEMMLAYKEELGLLTPEQRGKVLVAFSQSKRALKSMGWLDIIKERFLPIPDEHKKQAVAILFAGLINDVGWQKDKWHEKAGFDVLQKLSPAQGNFLELKKDVRSDLALLVLRNVSKKRMRERAERDQFLFTHLFEGNFWAAVHTFRELERVIFARDAAGSIAASYHLPNLEELHFVGDGEGLDLTTVLLQFSERHPELLPETFVKALWDKVKNRDVVITLLREFFAQMGDKNFEYPKDSLELLCRVTGLDFCQVQPTSLSKNPGVFYELILDIQKSLAKPAFEGISVEPKVFEAKPAFLRLLKALRDLLEQYGDGTENWDKIRNEFSLVREGLKAENTEGLVEQIHQKLTDEIRQKLKDQNLRFAYEDFERLKQEWGDLDPIWTLLSRFQSNAKWQQEVPLLIEVFRASLNGTFRDLKFFQNNRVAQNQLMGLDAGQQQEWAKTRTRLSVLGGEDPAQIEQKEAERLNALRDLVHTNLVPHLGGIGRGELIQPIENLTPLQQEWHETDLQKFLKETVLNGDPYKSADEFLGSLERLAPLPAGMSAAEFLFRNTLAEMTRPDASVHKIQGAGRLLMALLTFHNVDLGEMKDQIKADLKGIERLGRSQRGQQAAELIFSVLSSDPKLLLTIGDVVETGSCQNYKTGNVIQTLLGYVVDANVQAVVSFGLKQQDFEQASDYNAILQAVQQKRDIKIGWNGNKRVVTFEITFNDGSRQTLQSKGLQHGFLRQMVKLGVVEQAGRPGIRLEREYAQNHGALPQMRQQHLEIFEELKRAINASDGSPIVVSPSRNPGGVYSDLGGGQKAGEYKIP